MSKYENVEDMCEKCKGQEALNDVPRPMCGKESALFYAIHKDPKKVAGTYQKTGDYYDVWCLYGKEVEMKTLSDVLKNGYHFLIKGKFNIEVYANGYSRVAYDSGAEDIINVYRDNKYFYNTEKKVLIDEDNNEISPLEYRLKDVKKQIWKKK